MRALVVANPHAGGGGRVEGERILRRLRAAGVEGVLVAAAERESAAEALRSLLVSEDPEETRVIAAGGDGTINALLPALAGTAFPLAILPMGTLNALAGELGLPRRAEAALEVAVTGVPRQIDLGLANGRMFSQMAGIGFDGAVCHQVVPMKNKRMLSVGAIARGLRLAASYRPMWLRVSTEAGTVEAETWVALVANASRYAYWLRMAPGARVDDGWLDVWLLEGRSLMETIRQVGALLRGRQGYPGVVHVRAREVAFESERPAYLHVDGDPAGTTPARMEVRRRALRVIVPRAA